MASGESQFRVVIFSGGHVHDIKRLVTRIHNEVPDASVCGVLLESRPGKTRYQRAVSFVEKLRDPQFLRYVGSRLGETAMDLAQKAVTTLLRFVHGGKPPVELVQDIDCPIHVTTDYHAEDSLTFVRSISPDLGIVYGTRILKPSLFSIPRHGSINIHKRK